MWNGSWPRYRSWDTRSSAPVGSALDDTPEKVMVSMDVDKLQRLVTLQMPYGKHKGTVLADLPGNYLNWFAREGFPKGELGQLLALMHEIDHNGLSDLLAPLRGRLSPAPGSPVTMEFGSELQHGGNSR